MWRYGVPYGVATVRVPAHGTYEGMLVAGQREGFGEMRYASGDVYAGEWQRGLPHGQGVLTLTRTRTPTPTPALALTLTLSLAVTLTLTLTLTLNPGAAAQRRRRSRHRRHAR